MSDDLASGEMSSLHEAPLDLIHTTNGNGDISTLLDNQHLNNQVNFCRLKANETWDCLHKLIKISPDTSLYLLSRPDIQMQAFQVK